MSRNLNPRRNMPRDEWLDSEVAPFIRRILKARTDADRTSIAREFGQWLVAHGDIGDYAKWLLHPKLRWNLRGGHVSFEVHPWDNVGKGGIGSRIDNFWWVCYYPTPEWIASKSAENWFKTWFGNRCLNEKWPWVEVVAERIGFGDALRKKRKEDEESKEFWRKQQEKDEQRDRDEYKRLWEKYKGEPPT